MFKTIGVGLTIALFLVLVVYPLGLPFFVSYLPDDLQITLSDPFVSGDIPFLDQVSKRYWTLVDKEEHWELYNLKVRPIRKNAVVESFEQRIMNSEKMSPEKIRKMNVILRKELNSYQGNGCTFE